MTELLKEELAETNIEVEVLHIKKIDRPKFHHAFGAVVNFIPKLNIGILEEELDVPMFGISAHLVNNEVARRDTILAYKIASGAHGFVGKFNDENPFEVLATVSSEADIQRAKEIFAEIPAELPIKYSLVKAF
ncbi:MAG: hypothetical protein OHK0017_05240 [Patescibacteria group bacterium]